MGRLGIPRPIYGGNGLCCPAPRRHSDWAKNEAAREAAHAHERVTSAQVFQTTKGFRTTNYAEAVAKAGPEGAGAVHKVYTCQRADCTFTGTYALVAAHEQRFDHAAAADDGLGGAAAGWRPEAAPQTQLGGGSGSDGTRTAEAGKDGLSGGGSYVVPRVPNADADDGWAEKQEGSPSGDGDDGAGADGVLAGARADDPGRVHEGRAGESTTAHRHHHVETYRCSRGCGFVGTVSLGNAEGRARYCSLKFPLYPRTPLQ